MGAISNESGESFVAGFTVTESGVQPRLCLRDPIPELYQAAFLLDEAAVAHLSGQQHVAIELFRRTNSGSLGKIVRDWTESLWGKSSPYVKFQSVLMLLLPFQKSKGSRCECRPGPRNWNYIKGTDSTAGSAASPSSERRCETICMPLIPRLCDGEARMNNSTRPFRPCGFSMITFALTLEEETMN